MNPACRILVLSGKEVISDIRRHIFNNRIWPDFTTIPNIENPLMRYQVISTRNPVVIGDYKILATRVNHSVPAYGYLVEHASGASLLYTGDTGPTEAIWKKMRNRNVKALIVEVSFPDELSSRALATGHLSPSLLEAEFRKMPSLPEKNLYFTPETSLQVTDRGRTGAHSRCMSGTARGRQNFQNTVNFNPLI